MVGSHGAVNRRREKREKFKDEVKRFSVIQEEKKESRVRIKHKMKRKEKREQNGKTWKRGMYGMGEREVKYAQAVAKWTCVMMKPRLVKYLTRVNRFCRRWRAVLLSELPSQKTMSTPHHTDPRVICAQLGE